ncbi:MAG: choice-of-anchor L domain-containing protein [Thermoplasmatota archaeon]
MRRALTVSVTLALVLALAPAGHGAMTPTADPDALVAAMEAQLGLVTAATFLELPPSGMPHATSDEPLAGFPVDGDTYTILTTGDPALATTGTTGSDGVGLGGGNARGDTDWDVTVLAISFTTPVGGDCLGFDFRFLSEEYPEWVGTDYNDAFIAELDDTTWTTMGSDIMAPDNFAFDENGDVISINAAGAASMNAANAAGTSYDGASALLRAQTPVGPGAHTLFLSIFDQGDSIYDSTVFIDNLFVGAAGPEGCDPGVIAVNEPPTAVAQASHALANLGETVTFDGTASSDPEDGAVSAYEWRHGGNLVSTAATYATSFADLATECLELTVFDSLGATGVDSVCVDLTDELQVDVWASRNSYAFYQQPRVHVQALYQSGEPVVGGTVGLSVSYTNDIGPVNSILGQTPCPDWSASGTTASNGRASFDVPFFVVERCLGALPGLVEVPTQLPVAGGDYRAVGSVAKDGNGGSDSDRYGIALL